MEHGNEQKTFCTEGTPTENFWAFWNRGDFSHNPAKTAASKTSTFSRYNKPSTRGSKPARSAMVSLDRVVAATEFYYQLILGPAHSFIGVIKNFPDLFDASCSKVKYLLFFSYDSCFFTRKAFFSSFDIFFPTDIHFKVFFVLGVVMEPLIFSGSLISYFIFSV